jgi:hypothetical protein
MHSVSWSKIDTCKTTMGYLDSVEVANAKKNGVTNVFVGMIQADYEGTVNVDNIIEKYNKGSYGRMPYMPTEDQRAMIADVYREYVVLQCKYNNLKNEFNEKFNLWDDFKNFVSKTGLIKKNAEYNEYLAKLDDLNLKVISKEQELAKLVDSSIYRAIPQNNNQQAMVITLRVNPYTAY